MIKSHFIALTALVACITYSCGGDSGGGDDSAPTVSSVTDANGTVVETTDSTDIYPISFEILFSEAMDGESVTNLGNILMSCVYESGDPLTPEISAAASEAADNTYIVTVADAYKYALMTCTLTVTTDVTSSAGAALAEAAIYEFTNACAVSDEFNANSQSCWPDFSTGGTWMSWGAVTAAGVLDFDTPNSTLDYTNSTTPSSFGFYKQVSVDESGFELIVQFSNIAGMDHEDYIFVALTDDTAIPSEATEKFLSVGANRQFHQHGRGDNTLERQCI